MREELRETSPSRAVLDRPAGFDHSSPDENMVTMKLLNQQQPNHSKETKTTENSAQGSRG